MPTWVKVVLIVVLVAFLLLVVGIIVGVRWMKTRGAELQKQSKVIVAEAKAFGAGKDGEACVAEALNRLKTSEGFIGEAKTKIFLQNCLSAATVPQEWCAGVPPQMEIMRSAQWSLDECAKRGWTNNQRCARLVQAMQIHCDMTMKR